MGYRTYTLKLAIRSFLRCGHSRTPGSAGKKSTPEMPTLSRMSTNSWITQTDRFTRRQRLMPTIATAFPVRVANEAGAPCRQTGARTPPQNTPSANPAYTSKFATFRAFS